MSSLSFMASAVISERPSYLNKMGQRSGGKAARIFQIADMLKKVKKTEEIRFSKDEFEREFGQHKQTKAYFVKVLKDAGIKKPRLVLDQGTYHLWSNDD